MRDPGLDRHVWASEWQALEPLVVDAPAEALPELDRLVARMLEERGYPLEDGAAEPVAAEGVEPEVLAGFRAAHEIAREVEAGADVGPAAVSQAIGVYRELYEHLLGREAESG